MRPWPEAEVSMAIIIDGKVAARVWEEVRERTCPLCGGHPRNAPELLPDNFP